LSIADITIGYVFGNGNKTCWFCIELDLAPVRLPYPHEMIQFGRSSCQLKVVGFRGQQMNTAFQLHRDIVLGHVPNAPATFSGGNSSGKPILCGATGIDGAISTPSRYFVAMETLNTYSLFDGELPLEPVAIGGSKEGELLGLVVLNRLTDMGAGR
jgi:hypothetical protein